MTIEAASDELAALRRELAALRRELEESRAREAGLRREVHLYRGALDAVPESLNIRDLAHAIVYANPKALELMGLTRVSETAAAERNWRYVFEDGHAPTAEEFPTRRALNGEGVCSERGLLLDGNTGERRWLRSTAAPIAGEAGELLGVVNMVQDITEAQVSKFALREREAEKAALIERLELLVRQLSTPAIELRRGVLVVPVIGAVDERRGVELLERTLDAVTRRASRAVIVELTGAHIESVTSARQLSRLARALRLVGARCLLAGISPALARFLVDYEVMPEGVEVFATLERALERVDAALSRAAPGRR